MLKAVLLWCKNYLWKFALVTLVLLGAYLFYLDAQIQQRFSGNKWQVPAQLFARPLQLSVGQQLTPQEVIEELQLLSYRRVSRVTQSGEYSYHAKQIRVMRRAFDFAEGAQGELPLSIQFAKGRVSALSNWQSQAELSQARLEPWLITRLVSSDREDRMLVTLDQVPKPLTQALLLVEDRAFYQHAGVSPLAIARALLVNLKAGRTVQGGSTLTQQLVKNLFLTQEKTLLRKIKEALMALVIDARYSKDEILETYLNEVYLGQNGNQGIHGFGLASWYYFARPLSELGVAEQATLVAMVKGASYYHPKRHPQRTKTRRDMVLRLMFTDHLLDSEQYQTLVKQPLTVASQADRRKHPAFMRLVAQEIRTHLRSVSVRQSGIRVFTTMDVNAQRKAEQAMQNSLNQLEKRRSLEQLQGAMLVSDYATGEIRALVGDRNSAQAGFNRALQAKRQIGSLIKPAVYLTALQQPELYTLATPLDDQPIALPSAGGKMWRPQNADKKFRGSVNLVDALSNSLNVPTVNLGMEVGLPQVADTLQALGVSEPVPVFPSLTLGALALSPLQVNQMYQSLANRGAYLPLHAVQSISSADHQLLWQFNQPAEQRSSAQANYLLSYALHKVTLTGTAKAIKRRFSQVNMAGKTGTTDDYRDSWFSGFDNQHVVTTWVGRDDNQSTGLTGASGALQVFLDYQGRQQPKPLLGRAPQGVQIAHFDPESGRRLPAGCKEALSLPAISWALAHDLGQCQQPPEQYQRKKSWWQRIFGD